MCLAVPVLITAVKEDDIAVFEVGGQENPVVLTLVEGVKAGDYVLIHAGFAIEIIDEEEAKKTLALFEEIAAAGQ